ncbi:virulence protein RhuM/Fic/DOC family protein [Psychrosphaera sp. 1_MG-2023]|uniref:virulence protein RhuM/Fic/DOC family protein n=1 Tax=Psychrosphaera sp. 1_MG-2023 TaxID=3062643 RepID=UPI0026E1ADBC|nr:virulence protein RhuM/Fic/DOC family protein [Psychrosphaera sp. 1_MG-2023]MDO6718700.1 virulence protein RhuM/Fic/DOC family protein [Psychrosphaera sp. 1_MG-2023]
MSKDLEIYQNEDGSLQLAVTLQDESVWLTQADMVTLFDKNKRTISEHIRNIFKDEELTEAAVVRNFRTTAADGKSYNVNHYNLDVVISVGYRVKSKNGVRFRQWATKTLKQHLLQGYTLNQQRLSQNANELEKALLLVKRAAALPQNSEFGAGLVDIIASYTQTFLWLQQYDEGLLHSPQGELGGQLTPLTDAKKAITELKQNLMKKGEATALFANERDDGLAAIWGVLEQTVFGEPAYPSLESKAAHLIYFVVKNHPFSDGNKRTAAFLLVDFLNRNNRLLNDNYQPVINDTGLAAITLLVAESKPTEKDIIIRLIENLLSQ